MAIIDPSRLPPDGTWEGVGVRGGIPHRETIFASVKEAPYNAVGDGTTDDTAAIQACIDACPVGEVVFIPAGTYYTSGKIVINSGITVRGDGQGITIISVHGSAWNQGAFTMNGSTTDYGYGTSLDNRTIVSGSSRGSNSVLLSDASSILVGMLLMVDQLNGGDVSNTGDSGDATWASRESGTRAQGQTVEVTGVNGSTVSFEPALAVDYVRTPEVVKVWPVLKNAGIESLTIKGNGGSGLSAFVHMTACTDCWVKDIESSYCDGDHMRIWTCFHCEVRDSYFHDARVHTSGTYDSMIFIGVRTSECLIENNVFYRMHMAVALLRGACGNAICYNYSHGHYDEYSTNVTMMDFNGHGAHPMFTLLEGNIAAMVRPDVTWGTSSEWVIFRNWLTGFAIRNDPVTGDGEPVLPDYPNFQANRPINIEAHQLNCSVVGNVLGGKVWSPLSEAMVDYAHTDTPGTNWPGQRGYGNERDMYSIGYPNTGSDGGAGGATDTDETLVREGNYDTYNDAIVWNDATPESFEDSYYLSEKPEWFGNLAWPPVDPANPVLDDPTIIPAGYRYINGEDPPSGPVDPPAGPTKANRRRVVQAVAATLGGQSSNPSLYDAFVNSDPFDADLFSDFATGTWSDSCWARWWDFSGVAFADTSNDSKRVTMIGRNCFAGAFHWKPGVGSVLTFVDVNGVRREYTVAAISGDISIDPTYLDDVVVGTLTENVADSITSYAVAEEVAIGDWLVTTRSRRADDVGNYTPPAGQRAMLDRVARLSGVGDYTHEPLGLIIIGNNAWEAPMPPEVLENWTSGSDGDSSDPWFTCAPNGAMKYAACYKSSVHGVQIGTPAMLPTIDAWLQSQGTQRYAQRGRP